MLRKALDLFPGLHFNQFYGQTEASGGLSTLVASDHQPDAPTSHRLRSAGRPLIGARVGIFDSEGNFAQWRDRRGLRPDARPVRGLSRQ